MMTNFKEKAKNLLVLKKEIGKNSRYSYISMNHEIFLNHANNQKDLEKLSQIYEWDICHSDCHMFHFFHVFC